VGWPMNADQYRRFNSPLRPRSSKSNMKPHHIFAVLMALLLSMMVGCATDQSQVANIPAPSVGAPTVPVAPVTQQPTKTRQPSTRIAQPSITPTPSVTLTPSLTPTTAPSKEPTPSHPLIVIDPGHGGPDLGARHFDAQGHMDWTEAEVNLDVALRLRDILVQRGYHVLLTRDGDYQLNKDGGDINGDGHVEYVVDETQARVDIINASGADLLLAIHQNAFYGQGAQDVGGTVTYYCADRPFSDRNLRFAELVQGEIVKAFKSLGYEIRDRGVRTDLELQTADHPGRYMILLGPKTERIVRPCQVPGALSEALFITHKREAQFARDPAALDAMARAFANAICAYFAEGTPAESVENGGPGGTESGTIPGKSDI